METIKGEPLLHEDVSRIAIGAFFDVYNELAGFPEVILRRGLVVALEEAGVVVSQEVRLPVWFRGRELASFRADLIVGPGIIIEVKAAPELHPFHKVQLLHYLKATNLELGLVFNFGRRPEFARVVYRTARINTTFRPPAQVDDEVVKPEKSAE